MSKNSINPNMEKNNLEMRIYIIMYTQVLLKIMVVFMVRAYRL